MDSTFLPSDSLADQLSRLQQLVARRADELALELEERPDDLVLWIRAEAEIFSRHSWGADRNPSSD
jgi:hypothetical protein